MHIAEGVLSGPVLAGGMALAAVGTGIGLKKMDYDRIMSVAIMSAAFFTASLVHVPVGPSSAHLILGGLMGLVLGWSAFPAILVGLALQAVFFQFGGITVLGVNACVMAYPAVAVWAVCRPFLARGGRARAVAAFCAGALSMALSAVLMSLSLALSGKGFWAAAQLVLAAHLPIMLIEGVMTVFVVSFVARVQPEMMGLVPVPARSGSGIPGRR